ncbi:MAG TPA: glycosyltransferase [Gemmatimonadaceae bacterium]|nr:glycosyltransferase [Gemmatimonadaceae bacterium]
MSPTDGAVAGAPEAPAPFRVAPPSPSTIPPSRPAAYQPSVRGAPVRPIVRTESRAVARGKFLYTGGEKYFVRGVTYGPFRPGLDGCEYKTAAEVERDFAAMAASGINTVRTYTGVPVWVLDCAQRHGLRLLIGIAWPQHITFLDDPETKRGILKTVRDTVRTGVGHPAVLGYTVGNEIPASIVRWYGARRMERFIRRLYDAAKTEDPTALVTYVNYPTTEYLQLPFLDFFCFNVYLEEPKSLSAYVARLHNLAEDKPVILGELGLDSERNGVEKQASCLDWQIQRAFAGGCAGVCVFAWTDEWYRGGHDIEGWAFGLTDRERRPKPALERVGRAFSALPFPDDVPWPKISVVVCTYNGARYIRETCEAVRRLDYPDYECIFVCDGSTDNTMSILSEFDFKVVHVENGGLSRARNLGLQHADGEIVAYLDDDAYPDTHWLKYLAWSFLTTKHAGIGGPNLPPPDDDFWALCVAHSPGGPNHVLLADDLAEHIPGCNMAFRKSALERVGGFDRTFRIAGDDVDVCWRIQQGGGTLGFSPAAVVWHHRRNSVSAYLRQQFNYGRAEAMLEAKWPTKFNSAGHVRWGGRIYGTGRAAPVFQPKPAVYQGTWGTAPFQSIYEGRSGLMTALPMMPEWHLVVALLTLTSALGFVWPGFFFALFALVPAVVAQIAQSVRGASEARIPTDRLTGRERLRARVTIAALHYLQPLTRLRGRIVEGLSPWRFKFVSLSLTGFRSASFWHETWLSKEARLEALEARLHLLGAKTVRGGDFDDWDLEILGGIAGRARTLMAIEEHGAGRQLVRFRIRPRFSGLSRAILAAVIVSMLFLALFGATGEMLILGSGGLIVALVSMMQSLAAAGLLHKAAKPVSAPTL